MIALDLKLGGSKVSGRHLVLVIDVPAEPGRLAAFGEADQRSQITMIR
jgi:hypothetical protein